MIWESLQNNTVLSIGVYDMGGVGKTALLTHINNELVKNFPDTFVSWVTVSQKFTVHKLQDDIASALGFSIYEDDVKMHDLVRDMALRITSTSPRFLVEAGVELKEIPDEDEWVEELVKVSLMDNNLSNIIVVTTSPRCPKISTLLLNFNLELKSISDCFFEHMIGLNVLDLSYTEIESLPTSVLGLVNITALLLTRCKRLKSLPSLANLRALRRLDLSLSGITELPPGLEVLLNLRYLSLFTTSLQIVPGILANLVRLQLLVLDWHSSDKMRVRGEELTSLRRLETLNVQLHDVNDLNTYVKSLEERELISYIVQVGFDANSFWKHSEYTKIIFVRKSEILESASWDQPLLLPQGIQFLCIERCRMVRNLSEAVSLDSLKNLRACHVIDCEGIENLLSVPLSLSSPLLQTLEELKLQKLDDFRGLINENGGVASLPPPGTFSSLKDITINGCPKIKKLFTPTLVSLSQNLEKMRVIACDQLAEIIGTPSEGNGEGSNSGSTRVSLPKLMSLELSFLPSLTSFCDAQVTLVADSLEEIWVEYCSSLKTLSFLDAEMCPFPSLQKIKVRENWWDSLEWDHLGAKDVLRPLCHFQR